MSKICCWSSVNKRHKLHLILPRPANVGSSQDIKLKTKWNYCYFVFFCVLLLLFLLKEPSACWAGEGAGGWKDILVLVPSAKEKKNHPYTVWACQTFSKPFPASLGLFLFDSVDLQSQLRNAVLIPQERWDICLGITGLEINLCEKFILSENIFRNIAVWISTHI